MPRLTVATYNVENKGAADAVRDRAALERRLVKDRPDVVCIQEAYRINLQGIPGYRAVYHAYKGYAVNSENRAQAILVRDGVKVRGRHPLAMLLHWRGPKVGAWHAPRVHRDVDVVKDGLVWSVLTVHVPFQAKPVEETRKAVVKWLRRGGARIAVGDWNSLAKNLNGKVGVPAAARVDGARLDKAVFRGCRKVSGVNRGDLGQSDHDFKIWTFER